ncbi:MAG: aminotransferase class III-fold pyridoxal phosphate-dependent enzyme, partial [Dehalococcoidia bacterium]|nr:aminotransferase class III-fold pyridoxal phosphate-dependent enzyme [Dehalococcoidia bacterium]
LAMVAATGQAKYQEPYIPLPDGFASVEYNNVSAIKRATNRETCAVMLEPVQGEGGVNIPNDSYLAEVRSWCDQKGLLLILDEVQTGIGRLGALFGYQRFGVEPDIITLGKGLGGGFPIGAFLAKDKASVFAPGEHGSTFGGNPLACAAGYAVCKFIIDQEVPARVMESGGYLRTEFEKLRESFRWIVQIRGMGLLAAVQFKDEIADRIVRACLERGLLLNAVRPNAVRFMPPLNITTGDIDEAISILRPVLGEIDKDFREAA